MNLTWDRKSLGEVLDLQRGHDLPTSQRVEGPFPVIGSFGVTGTHNEARYDGPGVAIGRSGASIGKASFVQGPYWPLNTCLFVRDFKGNDPRWVFHLLDVTDFAAFNSGSAQPSLNRNYLRDIAVPVPPLPEQRAIAEVLGALDDKIANDDQSAKLANELCAAEVDRSLRESSIETKLRDVLALNYGKALPASRRVEGSVAVYGSGGHVGWHVTALVEVPGVVVGRKGTVGAVYWADCPHYPIDTTYFVEPTGELSPEILFYLLKKLRLNELNSDSAVPGLNREEAYAQPVKVPTANCAKLLGEILRGRFAWMAAIRGEMVRLADTREKLLPLLMSGKVRVKDAEKVVEDVT